MSSNLKLNRICEYCKKEFVAKTTVTRFCCHKCNSAGYKQNLRNLKIAKSDNETNAVKEKKPTININDVKEKDFLTVNEVSVLLNMSCKTVYRLIDRNEINAHKFSVRKTLVRRKDIEEYFESNLRELQKSKSEYKNTITIHNSYTIQEITDKYKVSDAALNNILKRFDVARKTHGKYTLVMKDDVDSIFK